MKSEQEIRGAEQEVRSNSLMDDIMFLRVMRKELNWLEGFSAAIGNRKLEHRVCNMRRSFNEFQRFMNSVQKDTELEKESGQ